MNKQKLKYKIIQFLFPKYAGFVTKLVKNKIHNLTNKRKDHKFLFILCANYCGSTLLNQIICTSKSVAVNNSMITREGQRIPDLEEIMFTDKRWDETNTYDWHFIKKIFMRYWDLRFPILLEKSPPNLLRANEIKKVFKPSFFVIQYRNPYAHCESLMRRDEEYDAETAAIFTLKCLRFQKKNIETLESSIAISYEELASNPSRFVDKISTILPELNDINTSKEFSAHNFLNEDKMKITDLNAKKIKLISKEDLKIMSEIFSKEKELLEYFNYQII
jgi:hypothetical protein